MGRTRKDIRIQRKYQKLARGRVGAPSGLWGVVLAVLLVAVLALCITGTRPQNAEQGAQTIKQTIMDATLQCMAIEGFYAPSVAYLEDNYGLAVNHKDFAITYEVYGTNVMPTVRVVPR